MKRIIFALGRAFGAAGRATVALIGIAGAVAIAANYAVTVGSGTTFGSVVVGGVNYAQQFICDLTTPSQCAAVDSSGILTVKGTVGVTGVATAANQSTEISSLATIATNTGSAVPPQAVGVPIGGVGLCDGANGATNPCTTVQTVLAASTASAAANKPAVVALHPSSGTPASLSPYPFGATPYTATATGTTGATTATLAGASSVTTYLCGFSIRANATAAVTGNATVTGVITATLNFTQWTAPLASGLGVTEMIFAPCIPASGTNQSVAVVSAAPGSGGVVSVTAWGYKL